MKRCALYKHNLYLYQRNFNVVPLYYLYFSISFEVVVPLFVGNRYQQCRGFRRFRLGMSLHKCDKERLGLGSSSGTCRISVPHTIAKWCSRHPTTFQSPIAFSLQFLCDFGQNPFGPVLGKQKPSGLFPLFSV